MKKILIINAHQPYPYSPGNLTNALIHRMENFFQENSCEVKISRVIDLFNPIDEVNHHLWADAIILQSPVNWMGLPWMAKKYIDEVYNAGMMGKLCVGDGRKSANPKVNYGGGGKLKGKKYMLSLTFNAPEEAFHQPNEYLFAGKSVDDLWFPQHMNFKFLGMTKIDTFACHDVIKAPQVESDFLRLDEHLKKNFL